jgi:hypothetical protein
MKSLHKAEKIFEKDFYILKKEFAYDWVDDFIKSGKMRTNFSTISPKLLPFGRRSFS